MLIFHVVIGCVGICLLCPNDFAFYAVLVGNDRRCTVQLPQLSDLGMMAFMSTSGNGATPELKKLNMYANGHMPQTV